MIVDIETRRLRTIGHRPLAVGLRAFVEGNEAVDFQPRDRDEAYGFVRDTLGRFAYGRLGRRDRGGTRPPTLSNGHRYNLRGSATYRATRTAWTRTRPATVDIALRQAPDPQGLPGHVRVDTVHQGDRDGVKGLFLINLVDPDRSRSAFAQGTLSPFLNFHRPCLFATEYRDARGRIRRKYLARDASTPCMHPLPNSGARALQALPPCPRRDRP